jgi:hypothetical protein
MDQLDGGVAVAGDIDRIASRFEPAGEEIGDSFFILDYENSHIVECTQNWPLMNADKRGLKTKAVFVSGQ